MTSENKQYLCNVISVFIVVALLLKVVSYEIELSRATNIISFIFFSMLFINIIHGKGKK